MPDRHHFPFAGEHVDRPLHGTPEIAFHDYSSSPPGLQICAYFRQPLQWLYHREVAMKNSNWQFSTNLKKEMQP
jgi:hypothetical protein